jgi:hypothetical protein|tara:strand:+ start:736 stop:1398 length:663 start_codon:yes stop_codon:yes gene_type:complete
MVRYKPSQFTKKELEAMVTALVPAAGLDFLTGGALNKYTRAGAIKITKAVVRMAIPPVSLGGRLAGQAALGTARVLGSSAVGAAAPIVTNPYVLGGALGYGALQTQPGQDLLAAAEQSGADTRRAVDMAVFNIQAKAEDKVKKTKSKFNRAVSAGMKAAKNSASYGKKGVISAPKKVFKTVTQIASKINKAKKDPKQRMPLLPRRPGPRAVYNAIKGIFK